jgi:hypothetical protein
MEQPRTSLQTNTVVQAVLVTAVMAQQYFGVAQPELVLGLRYSTPRTVTRSDVPNRLEPPLLVLSPSSRCSWAVAALTFTSGFDYAINSAFKKTAVR